MLNRTYPLLIALLILSAVPHVRVAEAETMNEAETLEAEAESMDDENKADSQMMDIDDVMPVAGYHKGKFVLHKFVLRSDSDRFAISLHGRMQFRYGGFNSILTENNKDFVDYAEYNPSIRPVRFGIKGHLWSDRLTFMFEVDTYQASTAIVESHASWQLKKNMFLQFGLFKQYFSRQRITSSSKQAFTDLAHVNSFFDAGYAWGLTLRNDVKHSPFEWAVGLFNPTGTSTEISIPPFFSQNTSNSTVSFVGRIGTGNRSMKRYSEADLEGGSLRWAANVGVILDYFGSSPTLSNDNNEETSEETPEESIEDDSDIALEETEPDGFRTRGTLDYIVKANGFSSTGGVFFGTQDTGSQALSSDEDIFPISTNPLPFSPLPFSFDHRFEQAYGVHAQINYLTRSGKNNLHHGPMARAEYLNATYNHPSDPTLAYTRVSAGYSVYPFADHRIKLQFQGFWHETEISSAVTDPTLTISQKGALAQLQLGF